MKKDFQMTTGLTLLLAITSGSTVANLYYAQPLLPTIAKSFHTSNSHVAFVITASQIGYVIGLLFLLPLGDLVPRKKLIVTSIGLGAVALAIISVVSNLLLFEIMSLIIGLTSVVAQVVVPLAADLSSPEKSGKTVGTVMSGLLIGILLARTFSGILASAFGISGVYIVAAVIMAIMGLILLKMLPTLKPKKPEETISSILKSTASLFFQNRILQLRGIYGLLSFSAFTILWTALSFYLAGPTYHYSTTTIGLFGLLGVAGASTARITGAAADKGRVRLTTGIGALLTLLSFIEMHFMGSSLITLAIGIVLLDGALQAVHISNQSIIYSVDPSARSRINSSYMTMYFIGGGIGSAVAGYTWQQGGWGATTDVGAAIGALTLIIWYFDKVTMSQKSLPVIID